MHPIEFDLKLLTTSGGFELLRGRRAGVGAGLLVKRPAQDSARGDELAALRRECALAASLGSAATLLPRLVELPGSHHMVMEDPGGELLTTRLANGKVGVATTLAFGLQVARALGQLHRRGLLHNGIRPDAILCSSDGQTAWLVDYGDAAASGSRPGTPASARGPARLTYLAPEQTGRLDHSPDPRSDLYALGIVLYEALTGAPPFRSDDALAQIHWHIAGIPAAPAQRDAGIPAVLSDLVMKLLAKAPDERYQSADGLAQDLARCARAWSAQGRIDVFPLGRRDIGERLVISSRLYGREREVHVLLDAFERVCAGLGTRSLVLVEGYSGIGKTALIQQLYRPIVRQKGYFISGKFDQVVRGVPFGALIQAFRGLVRQLLTESETQLAHWRSAFASALGQNGGVLAEVMPEIEFIVGPQASPTVLGSTEALNRFQRVLQQFVAALARPEHPLVLFLDDLQWADAATLGLLEPLLISGDIGCLMLMGAYRDNDLDASPRLTRTLNELDRAGVPLQRVSLGPLRLADLTALLADSLHCSAAQAEPLAALAHAKTGGNPFFVIQFLKLLEREGHVRFDDELERWTYRSEQIADLPVADNVVELMARGIQRLPARSQYALTLAASIGNRFDAQTLAVVCEQSGDATAHDLEPVLAEGLIVEAATGQKGDFAFLHDRVQQAAYALIPADRRDMVHLTIGRLLRARASADQLETNLFDIVGHLNLGRAQIRDPGERAAVAALDLAAGRRAKSSTAYDTALELFLAGIDLLAGVDWAVDDGTRFALHLEAAECRYLCGHFDAAQRDFADLVERARTPIERAQVVRLRSVAFENMARYAEALQSTREGLALFGVVFPRAEDDKVAALEHEIAQIDRLRGSRAIAALVELPAMDDADVRMVMNMLTDIWSSAYILGDPTLARLISATMVRLSLQHGNAAESAYGYVTHAITVGPLRGEYDEAYEFGCLALAVNDRFDDRRRRAKIFQQFHAHVNLWCRPLHSCIAYAREACRSGLDSGDFLYAAYGAGTEAWSAVAATQDLAQFVHDYAPSVALIERLKNPGFADSLRVLLGWARALQGRTAAPLSLSDASFDEDAYLQQYAAYPFFASIHAVMRLHLTVLLGDPAQALQAATHAAGLVHHVPGTIWPIIHEFWHGMAVAASLSEAPADEQAAGLAGLRRAQSVFESLARHCAENFHGQALLLRAEIARLERREHDAIRHCEDAIEFTSGKPLIGYQALAHELCARAHWQARQQSMALLHLAEARVCYARWGATAKAQAMAAQAPRPVDVRPAWPDDRGLPRVDPPSSASIEMPRAEATDGLDLYSVLKASQAIAAEVELGALRSRLLSIAIENAGAERGALVLEGDGGPWVYAADPVAGAPTSAPGGVALEHAVDVPGGIVNFVRHTGEPVVLAQADADDQHGADPYVVRHRPRSVLCLPLRRQGHAIGVLYLENRRVGGVFTTQRLRTMGMLATQAAISLENAHLVGGLKREIAQRERAQAEVERLKEDLEAENTYLRRDLIANVSHDLRTPLVAMRGYLELLATKGDALATQQRQQYLGIAVRQSEHLARLVDELFELAKLDFKGMTLNREPFAFAELVVDVMQKFQLEADQRHVKVSVDAQARLPFVNADLGLMERVLENLIGNALRHTPAGGCVSVSVRADGQRVHVQVADTGKGIAVAELPFIFDRFYRGTDGRTCAAGGAGLGLAITKRIIELHGAQIGVQSDGENGTRFRFSLPTSTPDRSAEVVAAGPGVDVEASADLDSRALPMQLALGPTPPFRPRDDGQARAGD